MEDLAKKLYELYTANMLKQGIGMDKWEDLSPEDRIAWDWTTQDILSGNFL